MELFMEDLRRFYGGKDPNISSRVSALCSYSTNTLFQSNVRQNFHNNLKSKDIICNPCDIYLSFEEEELLKNK